MAAEFERGIERVGSAGVIWPSAGMALNDLISSGLRQARVSEVGALRPQQIGITIGKTPKWSLDAPRSPMALPYFGLLLDFELPEPTF